MVDFYADRGFGKRTTMGKHPALVVVDMAVAFNDPEEALGSDQTSAIEGINSLVAEFAAQDLPVVYVSTAFPPQEVARNIWCQKVPPLANLVLGSPLVDIDARMLRVSGDYLIFKWTPSAFFGTSLVPILVERGVDTVLVTGCSTSGCVRATVVDALSYGFNVVVPREAVADRHQAAHDASMFDMEQKYANVLSVDELRGYVRGLGAPGMPEGAS
jgi:nicotinamidase-related amidase